MFAITINIMKKPIPIYREEIKKIYDDFKRVKAHLVRMGHPNILKCMTSGIVKMNGKTIRIPEKAFRGIQWAKFVR